MAAKRQPTAAPAWLPDWRDAGAYPDADAPLAEWRWQFLRRRIDYQADFENSPIEGAHYIRFSRLRGSEWLAKIAPPAQVRKYGLQQLRDPACPFGDGQRAHGASAPSLADDIAIDHRLSSLRDEGFLLVQVDLRAPVEPQLMQIRWAIADAAMERGFAVPRDGRDGRKHWARHLRVLDAMAQSVPLKIFAEALHSDYGTAEKWIRDAKQAQKILTTPAGR